MNEFPEQSTTKQENDLLKPESRISDLVGPERELQERIDEVLIQRFDLGQVSLPEDVVESLEQRQREVRTKIFTRRAFVLVTSAALVGVIIFSVWQFLLSDRSPFFRVQPLASIYNECLERGFEPSQTVKRADRVEGTFLHQHGVELTLNKLPADKHLLGISHLGGISRNTFAVLFEGNLSPVIVFIDKAEYHDPMATKLPEDSELKIFTTKCGDFVLYEVTPLTESMFLNNFVFPNNGM